jgi:peptide/nickel transport system substrate-binding protein
VTTGQISRRTLLRGAAAGGGLVALSACTGGDNSSGPAPTTAAPALPDVEGGTLILDPAKFPTTWKESPDFAAQVAAGKLPPVAQRIGQDPLVINPVHGIGKYGGEIKRGIISQDETSSGFCAGPDSLLYWDYRYENIVPNIAKDFEVSKDYKELTLHLRRGMRWSDGVPFTADDIIFWREDINLNPGIGYPSITLSIDGKDVAVEKVDDYTVVFRSPVPYATLVELIASGQDASGADYWGQYAGGGFAPKHYLSQFLPKYTSEAQATKLAVDAGFRNWPGYVLDRNSWVTNTDLPTLTPWICTRPINDPPWEFEANPYSIWVDSDGNQLPYVPKVSFTNVDDAQVLALNAVSGEYDYADRGLQIASLPLLIKNQKRSDYTVRKAPDRLMDLSVILNLSYAEDEMGDLIRTLEFRRALSLAVDRDQVNETFFLGTSIPSCTMVSDDSPYFPGQEWRRKWAELDIDQANELLDGIGLTKRNGEGFRMLPSGKGPVRLDMQATNSKADFPIWGDMIRRHWKKIGVDASSAMVDSDLLYERVQANKVMASLNNVYGVEEPFLNPNCMLPLTTLGTGGGSFAIEYSRWFLSNGKDGTEPPDDTMGILKDTVALYQQGLKLPRDQRIDIGKQVVQTHADQVWTIGVVGMGLLIYGIYLNDNNLENIPARYINTGQTANGELAQPFAFYYA